MDDSFIVFVYTVIDDLWALDAPATHGLSHLTDAEILTLAVLAAAYFQNHHERAVQVLCALGYFPRISTSRFNRRVHRVADWLPYLSEVLGRLFTHGAVYLIDSLPVPFCRRVRARRCRKARGRCYCGYIAAKKERFFGYRLHLVVDANGVPLSFQLVPAAIPDVHQIHELCYAAPAGSAVYGDKAYNCPTEEPSILADTGVRLVPTRKRDMAPNTWEERLVLRQQRNRSETVHSQLTAMGIQRLHARTLAGLELKAHASLVAVSLTNVIADPWLWLHQLAAQH
jgi:hypothetical protein